MAEDALPPFLRYSAAHLGRGSDVMGFDTAQSRDHHWARKTTLFLDDADLARHRRRSARSRRTLAQSINSPTRPTSSMSCRRRSH